MEDKIFNSKPLTKEEKLTLINGIINIVSREDNIVEVVYKEDYDKLQNRIDKAIEYIENCDALLWNDAHKYNFHFDDLLNILGDDKE